MKTLFLSFVALLATLNASAQQALGQRPNVKSPDVNGTTATLNYFNPTAKDVSVELFSVDRHNFAMTPAGNGLWSYTTNALEPELYLYSYKVDGQRMLDPANSYVSRDISTLSNYFIVSHEKGDRGWLYQVNAVPHGRVEKVWYDSPQLGMKRRMTVYLPAAYDGKRRFPVLYLLHGHGGDEEAWPELGRATQIMDNLIALGKAEPMIVVMPNGNGGQQAVPGEYANSMYKPSFRNARTMDGAIEAAFASDVVGYIDSHYRTLADKAHRAIAGLSMGGFHSLYISLNNPDMFDYVGLFSAAINRGNPTGDFAYIYSNLDEKLARQFAKAPRLYYIAIGNTDFLYKDNVDYRKRLDQKGYRYEYRETDGGHIWSNWRKYLNWFAPRLFKEK